MDATNTVQYRKAKPWQLYLFSIHDLLLICFLFVMNFITYLGAGYYGLLATTVAMIATASRIFDAITDPIIAFIVERTDGKFGRYRPTMILGWIISAISILGMYFFCVGASPIVFILIYAVYVIGYSFMMTSQGGARVAFTNVTGWASLWASSPASSQCVLRSTTPTTLFQNTAALLIWAPCRNCASPCWW